MKLHKLFLVIIIMLCTVSSGLVRAADGPEWQGQWVGLADSNQPNSWLCFRKQVVLPATPQGAAVKIACDSKYWLWVNGKMLVFEGQLKRGPTPSESYYDEVNLAPELRAGTNTIAVLMWYWGKHGFSHNSSGQAGLVVDGRFGDISLDSDKSWKVLRHPSYGSTDKPHPNYRLSEPNVQFDARLDIGNWMAPEFDDGKWSAAAEFGKPPMKPWGGLVARPIPQWKDSGLKEYENAAGLLQSFTGGVIVAKLPYNAHVTPYLKVEAPAGLMIDIRTDDYLPTGTPSVRAVYVTRDGVQEYESLGWMNGHEVHYTVPAGAKVLSLKYRETGYNADFAGKFSCDDPALNTLWEKSRRTLYVTMRDNFMDCPDRERGQWWGDAVNEIGESFYVFDSVRGPLLAKKAMHELAGWQRADGTIYSPVPAGRSPDDNRKDKGNGIWNSELPPQMLASIGKYGFWNYYWYTGDKQTIVDVYPAVRAYLALWKLDADGLVIHRNGDWDWVDWGQNADVAVLDSAWLQLALQGAVEMAKLTGNNPDVAGYEATMKSIESAFNKKFWRGDFYQSPSHKGDTDDRANAMAVIAGFAKPDQYAAIRKLIAAKTHASPYMEKYVLESLFMMGAPEQAIERMKARYADMIGEPISTLWENFGGNKGHGGSGTYNHAWSGGPLTMMSQYVAGIAPTSAGWKTFVVRPQPGSLNKIDACVSTPCGAVNFALKLEAKRLQIDLTVPAGASAKVDLSGVAAGEWKGVTLNGSAAANARVIEVKDGKQVIVAE